MVSCAMPSEIEKNFAIIGSAGVNNTAFTDANEIINNKVINES